MSMPTENPRSDLPLYRAERIIASTTVAWVIVLSTYMLFQDTELSYTSVYFLKIILALSGAVMLATLPGFFDISYNLSGFSVRAAGGAAAFVFIYTQSPNIPALKAEPAPTPPPLEDRDKPGKSDKLSSSHDGYPVLFALAISPASFAPQPNYYSASYGGSGSAARGDDGSRPASGGRISIGAAVSRDLGTMSSAIVSYLRSGIAHAKALLDGAASAFREMLDRIFNAARTLLGFQPEGAVPPAINIFTEELTSPLIDLESGTAGSLFSSVDLVNSLVIDGLTNTLQIVFAVTDTLPPIIKFVETTAFTLVSEVQDTTSQVLRGTTQLVDFTTGTLEDLTGGLAPPVAGITNGVIGKADKLTSSVLSKTAETTNGVLGKLNSGINRITERLNAVSPDIVSRIDPDFVAAVKSRDTVGDNLSGSVQPVASTVDSLTGKVIRPEDGLLGQDRLNGISDRLTFAGGPQDQPGHARLLPKITCISGCNPQSSRQILGSGLGNILGRGRGIGGSNEALSGGGLGGNLGNNGGSPPGGGGVLSSTVKTTGSLLGGTTKKLLGR